MDKRKFEDYDGFVEKFKPKKTTDDCYTPQPVYQCVLRWIDENITPLEGVQILRPFYPGNDYEKAHYPAGAIVIDNPPFSLYRKILRFYTANGIRFFLFAPELTLLSPIPECTYIITNGKIVYENGAAIPTGFVTNLLGGDPVIMCAPDLGAALKSVQKQESTSKRRPLKKYPANVTTSALLKKIARVPFTIKKQDCVFVSNLDNYHTYGGALLLSDDAAAELAAAERAAAELAAAELAAAERAAAERAAAEEVFLSDREKSIISKLGSP